MSYILFNCRKKKEECINYLTDNYPSFDRLIPLNNSLVRGDIYKIKEGALKLKEDELKKEYFKKVYLLDYYLLDEEKNNFRRSYDNSNINQLNTTLVDEDVITVLGYPKYLERDIKDYIKKNELCKIDDKNFEKVLFVVKIGDEYHYGLYDKKYLID
ncbi:MAG: hypothetical protein ACOCP4_00070 [Candidatus Woesearchaeota archaeon]